MLGLNQMAEQLAWYGQFRNEGEHDIYFNDHGNHYGIIGQHPYDDKILHVGVVIRSPRLVAGEMTGFYCHINFCRLMSQLLAVSQPWDWGAICSDYVVSENIDHYEPKSLLRNF